MTLPPMLVDLYRDLRDRRLLLPGLLLIAAMAIVPLGLSKSGSSGTPAAAVAPPASAASGTPPASESAVLLDNAGRPAVRAHGIRNSGDRLGQLTRQNPFKRQFALPKLPGGNPGKLAPPSTTSASTSTTSAPAPAPPTTSAAPTTPTSAPASTPSSSASSSSTPPSSSSPPSSSPGQSGSNKPSHKPKLYVHVVDVKVGLPDQLKRHKGVKPMTELPHPSNPVLAFLGATVNGKRARFLVSRQVTSVAGGSCSPGRASCDVVTLKPGGKAKLAYAPNGKTYVVRVLAIRLEQVKHAKSKSSSSARREFGFGLGASKHQAQQRRSPLARSVAWNLPG